AQADGRGRPRTRETVRPVPVERAPPGTGGAGPPPEVGRTLPGPGWCLHRFRERRSVTFPGTTPRRGRAAVRRGTAWTFRSRQAGSRVPAGRGRHADLVGPDRAGRGVL